MKRVIFLIICITILIMPARAEIKCTKMPVIKFNKSEFSLYYSAKTADPDSYINEYYKKGQTYSTWNELMALHHYPDEDSPSDQAKMFKNYLTEKGIMSELEIFDDDTAVLSFFAMNSKRIPILLEYNVFRFTEYSGGGTLGIQYAKRFRLNNALEAEKIKREYKKSWKKYVKKINKIEIPELYTIKIDEGKIITNESPEEMYFSEFRY